MRAFPAIFGALLITLAVFLFMQSLIMQGRDEVAPLVVISNVEILQAEPEKLPQAEPESEPERREEPALEPLDVRSWTFRRLSWGWEI